MSSYHLQIGGRAVAGATTMPVVNPATEAVITECARADLVQLNAAVAAAKASFPAWARLDLAVRRQKLLAIAADLTKHAAELARLLTAEQGKPLSHAEGEVAGAVAFMEALASLDLPTRVLQEDATGRFLEHRTPLGVVTAITPWNFPVALFTIKAVPALLAGNTVVAKPAPTTPLTTLRVAEIYCAHLPAGVLNVIIDCNDLGSELTSHPDVRKVSFTGSTATGKKVMGSAAGLLKRVTLELGGNDPAIVLDDVDPKSVARSLFEGAMMNSGQVCLAIKRAYVHKSQYETICSELASLAESAVVGDGMAPGTQFGPIQNKMQYERVNGLIENGAREGKIVAGGRKHDGAGYFVRPTIVRDIADGARLVREEQFGPVLPVLSYTDVDDAVRRANDTDYGLGGTVWSSDPKRAQEVAMRIDSGLVWVNSHMNVSPLVATGGAKQSGMGLELGVEGLEEFTQRHLVFVAKAPR
jgi:acyl-CoA reductase-like NAD-dependent aldehyde dehydrogenase